MRLFSVAVALSFAAAAIIGSGREEITPSKCSFLPENVSSENTLQFSKDPDHRSHLKFFSRPLLTKKSGLSPLANFKRHHKVKRELGDAQTTEATEKIPNFQTLEHQVLDLFAKMKLFKMQVADDPTILNTQYPQLSEDFFRLDSQLRHLETSQYSLPDEFCHTFDDLGSLFEMMELNIEMRSQGCQHQLGLEPGEEPRQTRLVRAMEKFDNFVESKAKCYDEHLRPRNKYGLFRFMVDSVVSRFEILKEELGGFTCQNTPLSRLFDESMNEVQEELSNLSFLKDASSSPSPSRSLGAVGDKKIDKTHDRILGQMESKLTAALLIDHQQEFPGDFKKLESWRDRLSSASTEVFLQLLMVDFPESPSRKEVENLLQMCRKKLSRNINSVLLLAISMASDGGEPDSESLQLFGGLKRVLHHDYENVEAKLEHVSRQITEISENFEKASQYQRTSFSKSIHIYKELLGWTSGYLDAVEWANMFHADDLKAIQRDGQKRLKVLENNLEN
ncbi:hypothetical protein JCM33374_g2023 [Metschnikowia sp. JCM 33374]|nr:hypothetical protein JCM33374_g2023 [Metschnikowia sp. JCM 33374]